MHYKDVPYLKLGNPAHRAPEPPPAPVVADSEPADLRGFYQTDNVFGSGGYYSDGQKFRGGIIFSGSSPIINHSKTRANAGRFRSFDNR